MKMNSSCFVVGLLALTCSLLQAGTAVHKSADGLDLPVASEKRFRSTLPIAGPLLGQRPEELGRVFNAHRSDALLAKRTSEDLGCEWFVINLAGADVGGIELTEGRVSKVALVYNTMTPSKLKLIHTQLERIADPRVKIAFKPLGTEKKPALLLTMQADLIEFYIASHDIDAKIAEGLRSRTWSAAMTDEQACLIGDGPGKYIAIFAQETDPKDRIIVNSTVFADAAASDVRMEFDARNKEDARQQALKKHKNLKSIEKMGVAVDNVADNKKANE